MFRRSRRTGVGRSGARLTLAAGLVAGSSLVLAGTGQAAPTAGCGAYLHPIVSGGEAAWNVNCTSTNIYASGWVKDTRADGKCAAVRFDYPDGSTWWTARACPSGTQVNFNSPSKPGRILDGYLTVT